ncbi:exodeoxyribonuclease VII large subunit [Hyphomicrobium sulfonivorans]|uniref:exodeoxyribonuclease VII large subunit n=1 Tax=Hyphomicrobium sulfonivorans TaxID=121290 RepID=UPI0030B80AD2
MSELDLNSQAGANVAEFTVSELSGAIKRSLEEGFGHVRLRGEISGFRGQHASGHSYFALKDDRSKIEAVIWKMTYSRLKVKPEEGMEVIVQGKVTSYPGSSKYQIVIESLEPAGLGALMALLEERKRRFTFEGLFAEERKRALPFLPSLVGIITSPTGAVIRDMLHGFNERFPTRVMVWPVRVQGETCAAEVANAIAGFNRVTGAGPIMRPDVLIVARGGGSLEDLWGFNEEIVVRAVAASVIPVISAVGHETDWTLIDLVADARAPTPTKAAEWAVPKFSDLDDTTQSHGRRLKIAARRTLEHSRSDLRAAARGLPRLQDVLALPRQRFDACDKRLGRALLANTRAHHTRFARISARLHPGPISYRIAVGAERVGVQYGRAGQALRNLLQRRRQRLEGFDKLLSTLSYQSVLRRGFALVRDADGRAVRSVADAPAGARLEVELQDGRVETRVLGDGAPDIGGGGVASDAGAAGSERASEAAVPAQAATPGVRRSRIRKSDDQGSLF